jgi:hypothetical protein
MARRRARVSGKMKFSCVLASSRAATWKIREERSRDRESFQITTVNIYDAVRGFLIRRNADEIKSPSSKWISLISAAMHGRSVSEAPHSQHADRADQAETCMPRYAESYKSTDEFQGVM